MIYRGFRSEQKEHGGYPMELTSEEGKAGSQ
jgi:hypothetical protein